jgi:hypothetical protein
MENVMIYHHLGLGDHFICNGLVRHLYSELKPLRLYLPTKRPYYATVARMYGDLPGIIPVTVNQDSDVRALPQVELCDQVIQVGFAKCRNDFDVSFYDSAEVPFAVRWNNFKIVRNRDRERELEEKVGLRDGEEFILVHSSGSVGRFKLNIYSGLRRIVVSQLSDCLLDWCSIAEKAEEVHCIDSSFIHLAQSLNIRRGVFHNIRPTETRFVLSKDWKIVDY